MMLLFVIFCGMAAAYTLGYTHGLDAGLSSDRPGDARARLEAARMISLQHNNPQPKDQYALK
jgi:hypothetical protein